MRSFHVWEQGRRGISADVVAPNIYRAVEMFAEVSIVNLSSLQYLACGTSKSNPGRFIAADGSARQFTAYEIQDTY